jgi:Domain of unknown function (DUF1906)
VANPLARITALEKDIAQAERDRRLEARWKRELQAALADQRHVNHAAPVPRDGIDYAFGHPAPVALRRAHVTFVVRYTGSGSGKDLGRLEAEDLSSGGLDLVVVHETTAARMLAGYDAGALDAKRALRAAHAAGMPEGRPVYYACDLEAAGADEQAKVAEYVRGAVHATSWAQVGVYGGLGTIEHCHALNRCRYYWQTLAWSHGVWSPHAQLRQVAVNKRVAGVDVDLDRAVVADFGQWRAR